MRRFRELVVVGAFRMRQQRLEDRLERFGGNVAVRALGKRRNQLGKGRGSALRVAVVVVRALTLVVGRTGAA